jgi:tubulin-like protein
MPEPFRAAQGSITPTLIVGLGGTGSDIVDRLAARAATLPNWESQLRPLTSFLAIDTNALDQHGLQHVPHGSRMNISVLDKPQVMEGYRRSQDPHALQWIDRGYQPRGGTSPGAGQIRVESRLGFFYHSAEIRARLEALVSQSLLPGIVWRRAEPQDYNVYLFATLAGGTGSGSFLSAAYLIDAVIREQRWQPRIIANLLLSTLMLNKVGPELHADIHANTYAALKELEHLTKLDYPQVRNEGRTAEPFAYSSNAASREVPEVGSRPFFLSFILDRPPHLGLPDAKHAIADAAFLQIFTPIIDKLAGEYDNYEKTLFELTRFPGELKDVGLGYSKNFGAFGAVAMVLPGRDLLEYCALRFAAEAMRTQITFGADARDPGDNRNRALAKLAVNYSDPKFLNLAEAEREKEIHRAFVASVQEMARQDALDELTRGFWYQMVETIDDGPVTGADADGKPVRGESLLVAVERQLDEARAPLLNKVAIRERAFAFHMEGVSQYNELVSRLREDVRNARLIVDEGCRGLVSSAEEGEAIAALKLDPIAERYLALRLLTRLERDVVPKVEQELAAARTLDLNSATVQKRMDELYQTLQDAARNPPWFNRDRAFLAARNEAEEYYGKVAKAARRILDAEVHLRQLRALADYLRRRSRQYARLANRMHGLVQDLEAEAERLRRGEVSIEQPLALRVEVFETMDEPRRRIWDLVYPALFLEEGRSIATFDRQLLAETIARELKPTVGAGGRVRDKTVDQTVGDLRRALVDLGRRRLRPSVLGDAELDGLDLETGLDLEARLLLAPAKRPEETVEHDEIEEYRDRKFRALAQLAGVLARVSPAEAKTLADGVNPNRTRQLIVGLPGYRAGGDGGRFMERLKSVLSQGHQVKDAPWHDPRLAIVHDVELPIPLYYFRPVVREIEEAYLKRAADEHRPYLLHTNFNWEKSLPNLNPRRSELTVDWSLSILAEGLVSRVFDNRDGLWCWLREGEEEPQLLGPTLSSALYRVGEIYHLEDLRPALERQVRAAVAALPDRGAARRAEVAGRLNSALSEMSLREFNGEMRRVDVIDRPILRTLVRYLPTGRLAADRDAGAGISYTGLGGD